MKEKPDPSEVFQLKISLRQISPEIWRRVLVLSSSTIYDLHHTIQIAMGWGDYHLNQFLIHGKSYGVYHDGGMSFSDHPKKVCLSDFGFRLKERFVYEYDFGDNWEHDIRIEKKLPVDPKKNYPVCIEGKRGCPPEDCGGSWRFMELQQHFSPYYIANRLMEIAEDKEGTEDDYWEEIQELQEWSKRDEFDRREANLLLKEYASSQKKEKMS